ncbi:hypothetical protein RFI_01692 [Reticulomyxa filosa]|uniref:Uncharacterized protein n=1 Tax=Reticulomyxa filosa TaxID=46433 RepID=X6PB52_RETFI|nr:hypothetical protein RFI_01692 [Reticulomyxa filosa]|eukprot:ETO35371.1 hypothetical protein RFI_01692 [Reticulomyxa filosa]
MGAIETVTDVVTDNKTYYNCPRCKREVWAYGSYVGNIYCINERNEGKPKNWYNMSRASETEVSLKKFLAYYDDSGTVVTINGQTFSNVIPKSKLKKAQGYERVGTDWGCGNNAINICLKMYDYSKQLSTSEYKYNTLLGCGWSYDNFYEKNIKPYFGHCGWKGTESDWIHSKTAVEINWSYINGTDFKNCGHVIIQEDKHV